MYKIELYHLVPWQRETTLVKEKFEVDCSHSGVTKFWNHLKNSANREIRTERLEDCHVVDLIRPLDCEYAINWVFQTRHINPDDKAAFAKALTQMGNDRWLWFGFRKGKG